LKINSNQAAEQRNQLRDLVKDQRAQIIQRQSEIENIGKLYDKKKEDKKVEGEKELVEVHDLNQQKLVEAVDGQSEKLEQLRTNLITTQTMLDQEHDRLVKSHQDQVQDTNAFYNDKFEKQFEDGQEMSKDINHKVNLHIKDIDSQAERNILKNQTEAHLKLDKVEHQNAVKVKTIDQNYNSARSRMESENSKALSSIEKEHQKQMNERLGGLMKDAQVKQQIQVDQMKNQDLYYSDLIKQKNIGFNQKIEALTKAHDLVVNNMKEKYQTELDTMIKDHAKLKQVTEEKIKDPFYQIETFEPKVEDMGDSYIVSLEIPETEIDSVSVTANKRKISVGFARRFQERMEAKDTGAVYHSARSEGHRKEIPVNDIVDSQHMEQKYSDGRLQFKIKKA